MTNVRNQPQRSGQKWQIIRVGVYLPTYGEQRTIASLLSDDLSCQMPRGRDFTLTRHRRHQ